MKGYFTHRLPRLLCFLEVARGGGEGGGLYDYFMSTRVSTLVMNNVIFI